MGRYLKEDIITIAGTLSFSSDAVLSPAAFAVDQDDYNPTGLIVSGEFVKTVLRLSSTGANSITGIVAPPAGKWTSLILMNVGSGNITLQNNDVGSVAANRFLMNGNTILAGEESVQIIYDQTSQRWREVARAI